MTACYFKITYEYDCIVEIQAMHKSMKKIVKSHPMFLTLKDNHCQHLWMESLEVLMMTDPAASLECVLPVIGKLYPRVAHTLGEEL